MSRMSEISVNTNYFRTWSDFKFDTTFRDITIEIEKFDIKKKDTYSVPLPSPTPPPPDFPDGGVRAWSVVMGAWLVSFATSGYTNSFGVYQAFYSTHQLADHSPSEISLIGSVQLGLIFLSGAVVGRLFDAGYIRWLLGFGSVWTVFCLMMLSFAQDYPQILLTQGFGVGLGYGILFTPSVSCVMHWFRLRKSFASGVLASGASVGGVVFPIMVNVLTNNPAFGFAGTVRATGFVITACLLAANFLVRTRLPPKKGGKIFDWRTFKDTTFTIFVFGAFFVLMGLYYPYFYIQTKAKDAGVSPSVTFSLIAVLNGASFFGRVLPTFIADKVGSINILLPACAICGGMMFAFLAVSDIVGAMAFAVIYGFFSGIFGAIVPACVGSLTDDISEIGLRVGSTFFIIAWAAIFGSPIAGALVDSQHGEYGAASVFSSACCFTGSGLIYWARRRQVVKKGTWKV